MVFGICVYDLLSTKVFWWLLFLTYKTWKWMFFLDLFFFLVKLFSLKHMFVSIFRCHLSKSISILFCLFIIYINNSNTNKRYLNIRTVVLKHLNKFVFFKSEYLFWISFNMTLCEFLVYIINLTDIYNFAWFWNLVKWRN